MYNAKAAAMRICKATKKDGTYCRAWAMWEHPEQLCSTHAGRHHRGPMPKIPAFINAKKSRPKNCKCKAYNWPHRPGGGFCEWPNPPIRQSSIPASTHSWPRLRTRNETLKRYGFAF